MKVSQHTLKQTLRSLIISAMRSVIKQPQIKVVALYILNKIPNTKAYLNNMALSAGLSTKQDIEVTVSEINNETGRVSLTHHSVNRVTDIHYFQSEIAEKLCQAYALNFDFELIEKIRRGQHIHFLSYSGNKLKITIVHFYLALLYRYPTATEMKLCSDAVIRKNNFEVLLNNILNSSEYKERGRKEIIK